MPRFVYTLIFGGIVTKAFSLPPSSKEEASLIVKLNSSSLRRWYDPYAFCVINKERELNMTTTSLLKGCALETENFTSPENMPRYLSALYTIPHGGRGKESHCCIEDGLMYKDRGFDLAFRGYEDASQNPMYELLSLLSRSNRSLVMIGDSMNLQLYEVMIEEIKRENITGRNLTELKRGWFHFQQQTHVWTPPRPPPVSSHSNGSADGGGGELTNTVHLYCIASSVPLFDNNIASEYFIPNLARNVHPGGLLVVANVGLHLHVHDDSEYNSVFSTLIGWLQNLVKINPRNIPVYRETIPSHFNSPDGDGSYDKWVVSKYARYNYSAPNPRDGTRYYCHGLSTHSRRDNDIARALLQYCGTRCRDIRWLSTVRYLAPFWKLKAGHCESRNSRRRDLDCVHFCGNAPQIWMPIWAQLRDITAAAVAVAAAAAAAANASDKGPRTRNNTSTVLGVPVVPVELSLSRPTKDASSLQQEEEEEAGNKKKKEGNNGGGGSSGGVISDSAVVLLQVSDEGLSPLSAPHITSNASVTSLNSSIRGSSLVQSIQYDAVNHSTATASAAPAATWNCSTSYSTTNSASSSDTLPTNKNDHTMGERGSYNGSKYYYYMQYGMRRLVTINLTTLASILHTNFTTHPPTVCHISESVINLIPEGPKLGVVAFHTKTLPFRLVHTLHSPPYLLNNSDSARHYLSDLKEKEIIRKNNDSRIVKELISAADMVLIPSGDPIL